MTSTVFASCVLVMSMSAAGAPIARLPTVPSAGPYVTSATSANLTAPIFIFILELLLPPDGIDMLPPDAGMADEEPPDCAMSFFCDAVICDCMSSTAACMPGRACVSM